MEPLETIVTDENKSDDTATVVYPTTPDVEGYFFEDEDDFDGGISTKVYENGNRVKRFILPDGRECIVRELSGSDSVEITAIQNNTKNTEDAKKDYMPMVMWRACKIDGKQLPYEEYKDMKFKVYNKIVIAVTSLNF